MSQYDEDPITVNLPPQQIALALKDGSLYSLPTTGWSIAIEMLSRAVSGLDEIKWAVVLMRPDANMLYVADDEREARMYLGELRGSLEKTRCVEVVHAAPGYALRQYIGARELAAHGLVLKDLACPTCGEASLYYYGEDSVVPVFCGSCEGDHKLDKTDPAAWKLAPKGENA